MLVFGAGPGLLIQEGTGRHEVIWTTCEAEKDRNDIQSWFSDAPSLHSAHSYSKDSLSALPRCWQCQRFDSTHLQLHALSGLAEIIK